MEPMLNEFEQVAATVKYSEPEIPIVLNRTGKFADFTPDAKYWRDHLRNSVRFSESVQELVEGTQEAPYFFSHADLVAHWSAKTGKSRQVRPHAH